MTIKITRENRVARITKWIRQQGDNPLLTDLHLETETEGEAPCLVASWRKTKLWDPQQIGQEIEDTLTAILAEHETRIVARIVWLTDSAQRWSSFPVRLEPEGGAHPLDGTSKSQAIQAQRHLEGMAVIWGKSAQSILEKYDGIGRTYTSTMEGIGRTMDALARVIENRENRTSHLEAELARTRDENTELHARAIQTEAVAEQAIDAAERATDKLTERKDSSSTDAQMLTLLTRVAQDAAKPPPKGRVG